MIKVIKLKPFHNDDRGLMTRLYEVKHQLNSVLLISSKPGAIRANHYHKKDTHWVYLLKGKFRYLEKSIHKKSKMISRIIHPGEMVVSRPNYIHAMEFLDDSVMIVFTTESRDQDKYERDTVRIKLI